MIRTNALSKLAVQGATTQERVVLNLFQAAWSVQALLVAGRGVAGSWLSFSLGFRAFENDDVAWHGSVVVKCLDKSLQNRIIHPVSALREGGDAQTTHFGALVKQRIRGIAIFLLA